MLVRLHPTPYTPARLHATRLLPIPHVQPPMIVSSSRPGFFARFLLFLFSFALQAEPPPAPPTQSAWIPTPFHQCARCLSQLSFDGWEWLCSQCHARYAFVPVSESKHTEKLAVGDFSRHHHAGDISLHGDDLRWYWNDGEKVHTQQLLAVRKGV